MSQEAHWLAHVGAFRMSTRHSKTVLHPRMRKEWACIQGPLRAFQCQSRHYHSVLAMALPHRCISSDEETMLIKA